MLFFFVSRNGLKKEKTKTMYIHKHTKREDKKGGLIDDAPLRYLPSSISAVL